MKTKAYGVKSPTGKFELLEIERRKTGINDVQIEILYSGICHSDIHTARNEWPGTTYPVIPGHEIIGKVREIGDGVKEYKVGDIVGVGCFVDSCRTCENCKKNLEQYCLNDFTATYDSPDKITGGVTYGGYSKQITVDKDFVLKISHAGKFESVAPLLCAGTTTYSPLKFWQIGKGHKVAIVGLGGLGHMAVKFAVSLGSEVTLLSHSPSKETDAKRLGAHKFALTTNVKEIEKLQTSFDFIIDTVSANHDYNMYLEMLKTDGRMICLGAPSEPVKVAVFNLIGQRRSISGSLVGGLKETQEMLDYCAKNNIVSDVEVINIEQIDEAYERILKGDVHYRFVIDMQSL